MTVVMVNIVTKKKVNRTVMNCSKLKTLLDLEFLLRCRDSNVVPIFLNFCVSSQSVKASLKLVSAIFYQIFVFQQMIVLQKL